MKLVLDTNVLVSGLLRPAGAPGVILQQAAAEVHRVCYDDRILEEYREVLARPRFAFNQDDVEALLDQLEADGIPVLCDPLADALPDRDDEKFLEVAIAASAEFLITGKPASFPRKQAVRRSRHRTERIPGPALILRLLPNRLRRLSSLNRIKKR